MLDVLVVGAGIGGLCSTYHLLKAWDHESCEIQIFEKNTDLGGTWLENTYPGVSCDTPFQSYALSFYRHGPYFQQTHPPGAEILDYLRSLAKHFEIDRRIVFCAEVKELMFEKLETSERHQWTALYSHHNNQMASVSAEFVVLALGQLNAPYIPQFPGQDAFVGEIVHTARWATQGPTDCTGKEVVIIGTGCSGVQVAPEIAKVSRSLVIVQRTMPYILPYSGFVKWELPTFLKAFDLSRWYTGWFFVLIGWFLNYIVFDTFLYKLYTSGELGRKYVIRGMKQMQPRLEELALVPETAFGTKRVVISNEYLKLVDESHVQIIASKEISFNKSAVLLSDNRKVQADVVVLATGFKTTVAPHFPVYGERSLLLQDHWKDRPQTLYGILTQHFPNMCFVYGPNTNLSHGPVTFMIETQGKYIANCICYAKRKAKSFQVFPSAVQIFMNDLDSMTGADVFRSKEGWYYNSKGENISLWSGTMREYAKRAIFNPGTCCYS